MKEVVIGMKELYSEIDEYIGLPYSLKTSQKQNKLLAKIISFEHVEILTKELKETILIEIEVDAYKEDSSIE